MNLLDLPTLLNNAMFNGNPTTLFVSQSLLSAIILLAVMLPLVYLKANMMQIFLIEFLVIGILTAMGWLNVAIMIVLGMIIAISFSKPIVDMMLGGRG